MAQYWHQKMQENIEIRKIDKNMENTSGLQWQQTQAPRRLTGDGDVGDSGSVVGIVPAAGKTNGAAGPLAVDGEDDYHRPRRRQPRDDGREDLAIEEDISVDGDLTLTGSGLRWPSLSRIFHIGCAIGWI